MGIVFFLGEWAAGFVLHFDGSEDRTLAGFVTYILNGKREEHVEI
jgi:hypothetical protein